MKFDLAILRAALYFFLGLFSFVLFTLCAARLSYTNNLPRGDPLNGGRDFYDPVVAELLVTTLFTMVWSGYIIYVILKRVENRFGTLFRDELIGLFILWLFWITGAAVASSMWGDLSFCQHFEACRVLTALVAFSWLGWLFITALLVMSVIFCFVNKALLEPLHGRWDPSPISYRDSRAMSGRVTSQVSV